MPVGASTHFAALVLEQILHPLALGRQLRLELVVHVSPMGGEGREGDAAPDQHPRPAEPPPGAAISGARWGRAGWGGGRFVFVLVRGFSAGGGGALRRHPLQLGSSRRGAGHAGSGSAAAGAGPGGVGGTRPRLNYDSRHAPRRRG